jgi:WD40 repeat protein
VSDGSLQKTIHAPEAEDKIITVSPDLQLAVFYNPQGTTARLWSLHDDRLTGELNEQPEEGSDAGARRARPYKIIGGAFSPDSELLALGSGNGVVRLWSVRERKLARSLAGPPVAVGSIAFDPRGEMVAVGYSNGTICVWRVGDGQLLDTLRDHKMPVYGVAWGANAEGRVLASVSKDMTVRVWRINAGDREK